jgi:hypothetical protein
LAFGKVANVWVWGIDKSIAVIAILFQLSEDGSTTDLLTSVTENIAEITTPGSVTETGPLDFCSLVDELSSQDLSSTFTSKFIPILIAHLLFPLLPPSPPFTLLQILRSGWLTNVRKAYTGSLTTPPCTSGPTFYITTTPLPLNVATYNSMKAVMGFNSRFAQNAPGEENLLSLSGRGVAALA